MNWAAERLTRCSYKILIFLFKGCSKETHQKILNLLPANLLRFNLTSYWRNVHETE
jgi:hypothetical protein